MDFEKIIERIAKQHGVTEADVYQEMTAAIDAARSTADPVAHAAQTKLGLQNADAEEVVRRLANEVKKRA